MDVVPYLYVRVFCLVVPCNVAYKPPCRPPIVGLAAFYIWDHVINWLICLMLLRNCFLYICYHCVGASPFLCFYYFIAIVKYIYIVCIANDVLVVGTVTLHAELYL